MSASWWKIFRIKGSAVIFVVLTAVTFLIFGRANRVLPVFWARSPLAGKTVVIDPGHGGIDGGTYHKDGTLEKHINLAVATKLKGVLEKSGAKVVMTRTKDESLDHRNNKSNSRHKRDLIARVDIINEVKPDIYLSLHVNAERGSPATRGPMVFYYIEDEESKRLAELIQAQLEEAYKSAGQEVRKRRPFANSSLFLLCNARVPGVIVELGFMTNAADRRLLQNADFQYKLSSAIERALREYF
ncbi:N-acetylmuramoyl-L-alanine amidase [Thermosediminibacter oceani]|uniref:Cell wall hydrolase/autolysin n=1 Tax=Thermosediminibacter oceani (strain ATCC BAA-1034 / DSM 16646 / JW/IW-1228P) TaxID=555079 RepID=D9RYV3_THEOJ|nr:N-acetylmuramoyl-L-alanine amidase [Thermosediminibacter oceani]ADL08527.1 cell wall hydrolase/autolysin [Thermosediminibacter oceani DSM 16646]